MPNNGMTKKLTEWLEQNEAESRLTSNGFHLLTVDDLRHDAETIAMLQAANATMKALGYT